MTNALDVAWYFLSIADEEDLITNLKLQKLVYYGQGFYLALYDKPLFNDPIEAWTHGPVVPSLYYYFKDFESGPIRGTQPEGIHELSDEEKELLNEVYEKYGSYTASTLRNITHSEPPWAETIKGEVISKELLLEYFKTRIN